MGWFSKKKERKPELKQFGDLRTSDFERVPVWAACHSFDHEEAWYDDTDEETFRPWTGELPVDPSDGMFLVRAELRLADGRTLAGFATPAITGTDAGLGTTQPHIALDDEYFGFWGGLGGIDATQRADVIAKFGGDRGRIFPIQFRCDPKLTAGTASGTIDGFYRSTSLDEFVIE